MLMHDDALPFTGGFGRAAARHLTGYVHCKNDLIDFEIIPVLSSAEAIERVSP